MQSCGAFGLKNDTALPQNGRSACFCPELLRKIIQNCYGFPFIHPQSLLPFRSDFLFSHLYGCLRENRAVSVFSGKVEQRCPKMPEIAIFTPSCVGKLPKTAAARFRSILFYSVP